MSAISLLNLADDNFPEIFWNSSPQDLMQMARTCRTMDGHVSSFAKTFFEKLTNTSSSCGRLEQLVKFVQAQPGSDLQRIGYIYRRILEDYDQIEDPQITRPTTLKEMMERLDEIQDAHADSLISFFETICNFSEDALCFYEDPTLSQLPPKDRAKAIARWLEENQDKLNSIEELSLGRDSSFSRIPPQIALLTHLVKLDVLNAGLTKLPRELLALPVLGEVRAIFNRRLDRESSVIRELREKGCPVILEPQETYTLISDEAAECFLMIVVIASELILLLMDAILIFLFLLRVNVNAPGNLRF